MVWTDNSCKIFVLVLQLLLTTILCSVAGANSNGVKNSSLLEQSKQVIAGKISHDGQWIEEKTGQYLPLDLEFIDEKGNPIRLQEIIDRPTLFLPIYFYSDYPQSSASFMSFCGIGGVLRAT